MARAKAYYAEGQEKFDVEDFDGALAAFSKSFDAFPHFRTIFNIGLCYEKLGDGVKAIDMYQRYLEWPSDVPNRDRVARKVLDLKEKHKIVDPEPAEVEAEAPPVEASKVLPPPNNAPDGPQATVPQIVPERVKAGREVTVSGWVLMGTGAAGVAAGAVLLGLARSRLQDMRDAESAGATYRSGVHGSLKQDGERFQLAGWITGAVGIGTVAAGATLILLSRFKPEVFSRVSIDTAVSDRGVRAHFTLRF